MFTQRLKQTAYAMLAGATLSIAGAGFTTSAQAAPLNINPIPLTQTTQHRSHFRGHSRSFKRGHHRSSRFSRHGRFHHGHRSSFRGHGYYGRGIYRR